MQNKTDHSSLLNESELDKQTANKLAVNQKRIDTKDLKVSYSYLLRIALLGCLGAAHFGTAINLTNSTTTMLPYVLNFIDKPKATRDIYMTIISSTSVAGVSLGSVFGGSLIPYGRRKMYILFALVAIIGCILSTFPNMGVMIAGRFIYGFGSGVMCVAGPRIMNEIVPNHLMDLGFNSSTNIFINIFSMMSMLLGLGSPKVKDVYECSHSYWYKIVYLVPVIFCTISILLMTCFHRCDSIVFHIQKGEKKQAMGIIEKIYPTYGLDVHEQVYKEYEDTFCSADDADKPKLSAGATLFGREYRIGSWVCIFVAAANTLAGVNLVNQYAFFIYSTLNDSILDSGKPEVIHTSTCVYIVGIFGFLGSLTALGTVKGLTRRIFFIGGHSLIGASLVLCIIFSHAPNQNTIVFLVFHLCMIISFQGSNGAGFWVYAGEVANDVAMGICLLIMLAL